MRRIYIYLIAAMAVLMPAYVRGQEQIMIEPLFEYPVAPDELTSLEDKSNYLMEHFWDGLDLKSKSVSQYALDDAFAVYTTAMRFADRDVVHKSIDNLLKRVKKNPGLLTQMIIAAEDNLYGKRADIHSDEAYIPFLKAAVGNKKTPKLRKARWERQLKQLEASQIGSTVGGFDIEERTGGKGIFVPRHKMTIIEFGDPGCDDCRFSRLDLETNVDLGKLVDSEKVGVAFIVVAPEEGWQREVADYPSRWLVASAEGVDDVLDIRESPTFYVLDSEGKIVAKNVSAKQAAAIAINGVTTENK